jgi:hypothetical protein
MNIKELKVGDVVSIKQGGKEFSAVFKGYYKQHSTFERTKGKYCISVSTFDIYKGNARIFDKNGAQITATLSDC